MKNIILFGAPGSGKGTQSEKLIEKYGLVHISTGELLRQEMTMQTNIGVEIKETLATGKMVSDDIIFRLIEQTLLTQHEKGFIFDGFPRNKSQMDKLEDVFTKQNIAITHVLSLKVPQEELVQRIVQRGKLNNRTDDQNEVVIKGRIRLYHAQTTIIADFYKQKNIFFEIDGLNDVESVFAEIVGILEN